MKKAMLFFLLLLTYNLSYSQEEKTDSIEYIAIQDTIKTIISGLNTEKYEIQPVPNTDSLQVVVNQLNYILNKISINKNDTTANAIKQLINYVENRNIEPALKHIQIKLNNTNFIFDSTNLYNSEYEDSLRFALHYLLSFISNDSVTFVFKNNLHDTILLETTKNKTDSLHLKLYDHRGEYVVLWIKKNRDNSFDISLEDGFYFEKTKQKKSLNKKIDTDKTIIAFKKITPVSIDAPMWKSNGSTNIQFSQSYLSDWVAGGENSLTALSVLKYNKSLVYGKRIWDNDFEYKLGYIKAGEGPLQKNEDKLEINSKYGHVAFNNWYYSFLFNFKTQFLRGYDYPNDSIPISGFLSPGYLVFSFGLDYKPNKNLTFLISPITSKFTLFADTSNYDQTRFGVGIDEKIKKEIGAYIKTVSVLKIGKNIVLENKVNFFTNYIDNPQNIDIDWEATLNFQLNEYIKFSLNGHAIYDDDVEIPVYEEIDGIKTKTGITKNLQWKEIFSIGFIYKFYH